MLNLLDLPEDIIIIISAYISPEDLLSLNQTCRGLHVLGSTDYVWHRVQFDVPLDIPLNRDGGTAQASGRQIRQSAVRALRLEKNWGRKESKIARLTRIPHGDIVFQLQFIGSSSIVTLSRSANLTTRLSLWNYGTSTRTAYCVTSFEVPHATRFTVGIGDEQALIAVLVGNSHSEGCLRVFSVLVDNINQVVDVHESIMRELLCESRLDHGEIFFDIHISGHIIAAGIAQLSTGISNAVAYRLLLVNLKTNVRLYIDLPLYQERSRIRFKLYPSMIFVLGVHDGSLLISSHPLPEILKDAHARMNATHIPKISDNIGLLHTIETWGPPIMEYQTCTFPSDFEFYISSEPTCHSPRSLPIVVFHSSGVSSSKGVVTVYQVPLNAHGTSEHRAWIKPVHSYSTAINSSPDIVCAGETGNRLVWLERRWDTDEYRFMKAALKGGNPPFVESVWPSHMALPFEPHMCQAMYFEECSGRICFALHTEQVYVMEF